MRSLNLKRVGAVVAGAAMLTSAISGAVLAVPTVDTQTASPNLYSRAFYLDDATKAVKVQVVLGSTAGISDGVAAAKLAAKLASVAYTSEAKSESCTLGGASGVTCSAPSASGSVTVSASTGGSGSEEVNQVTNTGVLLEENISTATGVGLAAAQKQTMEAGAVDFLAINSFKINDTDYSGTEKVIVNPNTAASNVIKLKYDESTNESTPRWFMELADEFVAYVQEFEPSLLLFSDATKDLTATFTDRVPNIPIAGVALPVRKLDSTEWQFASANSQTFDSVSKNDPPVTFGDWSVKVTDVFDNGAGSWYASITVTRAGNYQTRILQEGQSSVFGSSNEFGGAEITVTLDMAVGVYASFSAVEGSDSGTLIQTGGSWFDNENWTAVNITDSKIDLRFNRVEEADYQVDEGKSIPAINDYWNMQFVQFVYPTSYEFKVRATNDGNAEVTFPSVFGAKTVKSDDYYVEYPETFVDDSVKAGIKSTSAGGWDTLVFNRSAWNGVVIGDRVYSWTTLTEDDKNYMQICYELTGSAKTCLAKALNNTAKSVSVPIYNPIDSDATPITRAYEFYWNKSGATVDQVMLTWNSTFQAPGTIVTKGLGTLMVNTSMVPGETDTNTTVSYSDAVGDATGFKYNPFVDNKGWKSTIGTFIDSGIDLAQDEVTASDRVAYTAGLGTKYEATSATTLTITAYKEPVKVQFWVGGEMTSSTSGSTSTATFTGTGTKSGITVSAFSLNPVDCTSYCTPSFGGGTGSVNYTKVTPYVPSVSSLVVLDSASVSAPGMIVVGGQFVNTKTAASGVSLASGSDPVVTLKTVDSKPAVVVAGYTAAGTTEAVNELINMLDMYVKK
jgi:hypothetical protein